MAITWGAIFANRAAYRVAAAGLRIDAAGAGERRTAFLWAYKRIQELTAACEAARLYVRACRAGLGRA